MRILISPDKFKGSLDAALAAQSIRDGFAAVFPHAEYDLSPIADGGEGTGAIFMSSLGGEEVRTAAHDALGRPISAAYIWFPTRKLAVVEMSEASGLWRLTASELNPLVASTYGTGELMADAIARGAETLCVTLGGSATNDAGIGMAAALGWKFIDGTGNEMTPVPENFGMIHRIVPPETRWNCRVKALSDVNNPLLGSRGATRIYAAQKGADAAQM
ncbi:MAG TPA: glycerate kinase, partial [Terrimicrobiaceae bacterium]|nr:glycerate kinase [Terrimicrobiaceae bacterium]